MNLKFRNIYFIGIGGIGMSAIAKYFNNAGFNVAGYDAVKSEITNNLVNQGINIHFSDDVNLIPPEFIDNSQDTLIVYTPAIPKNHSEFCFFKENNYQVLKRAKLLGFLSEKFKTIAVAGTHGKTTISAITAHIFKFVQKLNAGFIGGILKNYNSNLVQGKNLENNWLIIEADEFDKSFLNFFPQNALISAIEQDHLDIYKNKQDIFKTFEQFSNQVQNNIVINENVNINITENLNQFKYGLLNKSDFFATNITVNNKKQIFDIIYPKGICKNIEIKMPGKINVANTVAAFALAFLADANPDDIKLALSSFKGIKRRFDLVLENNNIVFINDYAHHPTEIDKLLDAVKTFYPNKKITVVFQPHLYSRTRDFADGFASVLSDFDDIILMNIYPAREKPINRVSSQIIFDKINNKNKILCSYNDLLKVIENKDLELLLTVGAGDIDFLVNDIKNHLIKKYKN